MSHSLVTDIVSTFCFDLFSDFCPGTCTCSCMWVVLYSLVRFLLFLPFFFFFFFFSFLRSFSLLKREREGVCVCESDRDGVYVCKRERAGRIWPKQMQKSRKVEPKEGGLSD